MSLQVYSTLTRRKEPFPKKPGEPVTMYVCGPTVYKPSHVGRGEAIGCHAVVLIEKA